MDKLTRAKLEIVLSRFDFETVQKVMELTEWTYADDEETPDEDKLRNTAKELLLIAYNDAIKDKRIIKESTTVFSGGFEAVYIPETNVFELKFILDQSDSRMDDED